MKRSKAEVALVAFTALFCAFLLGFFIGRSGTRGTLTVQSLGLSAPVADTTADTIAPAPSGGEEDTASADAAVSTQEPVNINTATSEQLQTLPGIGEVLAQRIIAFREENGPFRLVQELTDVRGIGDSIYDGLKDYITVG